MLIIVTSTENTMNSHINKASDTAIDLLDKVSTPTSRAGTTIERVGKMHTKRVDKDVIALQLTKNSKNGNVYSETHVDAILMIYEDTKTKVGITKTQATALIEDQNRNERLPENYSFSDIK